METDRQWKTSPSQTLSLPDLVNHAIRNHEAFAAQTVPGYSIVRLEILILGFNEYWQRMRLRTFTIYILSTLTCLNHGDDNDHVEDDDDEDDGVDDVGDDDNDDNDDMLMVVVVVVAVVLLLTMAIRWW
ncbi:hypothetical protein PoB_005004900 [Plakobranchus ocellatus]|uniref:Uncharacterized protein n=1 Tax=Plakobranchus ocellatus TaxID=259542 RepID=A0AAV4BXK5_9GAST|nr:hypothetical protein PoB_005004900 [Plakobranchus ocellatus]